MKISWSDAILVISAKRVEDVAKLMRNTYCHTINIIFVDSGTVAFRCSEQEYFASAGDIILYCDMDYDISFLSGNQTFSAYNVSLNALEIKNMKIFSEELSNYMPYVKSNGCNDRVSLLRWHMKCVTDEFEGKDYGYEEIERNHIISFIILINRFLQSSDYTQSPLRQTKDICKGIKDYIDRHYAEDLNIKCLANNFYISCNYMSRLFKKRIGYSPINYLIMVRLGRAKKLLATTELSVQDIAANVGYDNANYFSLVFKKHIGISPTEFRLASKRQI